MNICGFQKLTLLDYPGHTACTLFTGGCNMRCPFCHNTSLVTGSSFEHYSEDEVFSFLKKRRGLLDGVAVTGGEPLLQKDIIPFFEKIKELGYKIKLDTNGSFPQRLKELTEKKLVDFIAMDIKNTWEKYSATSGIDMDISLIKESIDIIRNSGIEHEFRTTAVNEFHKKEDIISIAEYLGKSEKYYIQCFRDSGDILADGLTAPDHEMLKSAAEEAGKYVKICETRGI